MHARRVLPLERGRLGRGRRWAELGRSAAGRSSPEVGPRRARRDVARSSARSAPGPGLARLTPVHFFGRDRYAPSGPPRGSGEERWAVSVFRQGWARFGRSRSSSVAPSPIRSGEVGPVKVRAPHRPPVSLRSPAPHRPPVSLPARPPVPVRNRRGFASSRPRNRSLPWARRRRGRRNRRQERPRRARRRCRRRCSPTSRLRPDSRRTWPPRRLRRRLLPIQGLVGPVPCGWQTAPPAVGGHRP